MKMLAYSVYDNKSLSYGMPFFAPTDGSAVRSFAGLANDAQTTVGQHPSDFSLFCVGEYDDQNGSFVPAYPLRHVIDATALVRVTPQLPLFSQPDQAVLRHGPNGEAK
jgi:hypothetical protein